METVKGYESRDNTEKLEVDTTANRYIVLRIDSIADWMVVELDHKEAKDLAHQLALWVVRT